MSEFLNVVSISAHKIVVGSTLSSESVMITLIHPLIGVSDHKHSQWQRGARFVLSELYKDLYSNSSKRELRIVVLRSGDRVHSMYFDYSTVFTIVLIKYIFIHFFET